MTATTAMRSLPKRMTLWTSVPVLIAVVALLFSLISQPPPQQQLKPRVFVIGLSKTGTTSIGDALELLGYRRLGWRDIRSRHIVHTWANGDLSPLVALTQRYDALEDLPWPFVYREMAELYPDARFVLSLRRDEETWMRSMRRHVGRGRWQPYTRFYGADSFDAADSESLIRASYTNHTAAVRAYFAAQPHRYRELNIDDDGGRSWAVLCELTGQCPPDARFPDVAFPRANTAAHWDLPAISSAVRWWWGWLVTRLEELSARHYYELPSSRAIRPVLNLAWMVYDVIEQVYSELYFLISPFWYPQIATLAERRAVQTM